MTALKAPKKASQKDWHPAEVVAALHMKGISLRQLSLRNGYSKNSLAKALHQPYPLAESLIAEVLDISAPEIWPSRYGADGKSNRKRGRPALLPAGAKPSRLRAVRNPQNGAAK